MQHPYDLVRACAHFFNVLPAHIDVAENGLCRFLVALPEVADPTEVYALFSQPLADGYLDEDESDVVLVSEESFREELRLVQVAVRADYFGQGCLVEVTVYPAGTLREDAIVEVHRLAQPDTFERHNEEPAPADDAQAPAQTNTYRVARDAQPKSGWLAWFGRKS